MNTKEMIILMILICCLYSFISPSPAQAESNSNQVTTASQLQMQTDINEILKDPKFNYPDHFRWLKNIWRKVTTLIKRYQPKFPDLKLNNAAPIINKFVIGLVIILPIIIIYFLSKLWSKEKTAATPSEIQQLPASYQQMIAQATEFQKSGLYLESVRHFYLTVLYFLKEKNLIPNKIFTSDNETRKYLQKTIGASHPVFISFCKLLYLFQEKWYGLKSCMIADSIRASELTEQIINYKDVNLNKITGDIYE